MSGSPDSYGDCLLRPGSRVEIGTLSGTVNTFNQIPRQPSLTNLPSPRLTSSFASISLKGLTFGHSAAFQYFEHIIVFARSLAENPSTFCCRCCLMVALDLINGVL